MKKFRSRKINDDENKSYEDIDSLENNNKKIIRNNKKLIINFIVFLSIMIMGFGIIFSYSKIRDVSNNENKTPYEDYDLLNSIADSSFVIYKDVVKKQSGTEKSIENIYINSVTDNNDYSRNEELTDIDGDRKRTRYVENVLEPLQSRLYRAQSKLNYDLKNLDYAALDKDGNLIINRGIDNISSILSQGENGSEILKDVYGFYVVVNYDNNGYPQIKDFYGTEFSYIRDIFGKRNIDSQFSNNHAGIEVSYNNFKDVTLVYGIPKTLKYDVLISNIISERVENYVDPNAVLIFGSIVGVIVLFAGLIIPYKIERKVYGFNSILKIPFEIACGLYGIVTSILVVSAIYLVTMSLDGEAIDILKYLKMGSSFNNGLIYVCNLALWMVIIYFILSGMTYLKNIFSYGFKKFLKEKVLIVRILRFVVRKSQDGFDYLNHIDLKDKPNKVIIKVLIINFIAISVISIMWFFGIFAAIVYNIILFILIRKYYDKVRNNYESLLNATNNIAEGKLDFEISEDLGLFNSFKNELEKIQYGFKKAVDEEVKSQKMKTELISNVSHELKTPLTSIITYVDLLKNEDINEDERKSYINTIDKKSQRLKFLIEDLFEVSKATSGNIKLNPVKIDIVELIKQVEIELADKLNSANVIIKNNFPDNKIILNLDSQKTFRVFENLLNNVSKYSMEGSRVYVDIIEFDGSVVITIKNMSAVEIDYKADEIIERFQRGDKSRNTEGSGLGLAIAKSFVEAQNGDFIIELDGDLFKVIISL